MQVGKHVPNIAKCYISYRFVACVSQLVRQTGNTSRQTECNEQPFRMKTLGTMKRQGREGVDGRGCRANSMMRGVGSGNGRVGLQGGGGGGEGAQEGDRNDVQPAWGSNLRLLQ